MAKISPTPKQRKVLAVMAENSGLSARKALLMAGYSQSIADNPKRITQTDSFQALAEQFLPADKLLKITDEGLTATKVLRYKGQEFIDPDYYARHQYLETALRIRNLTQTGDTPLRDINIQIINYGDTPLKEDAVNVKEESGGERVDTPPARHSDIDIV